MADTCAALPWTEGLRAIPNHIHQCARTDHLTSTKHVCSCGEQWDTDNV